jgi:hypothetical protein
MADSFDWWPSGKLKARRARLAQERKRLCAFCDGLGKKVHGEGEAQELRDCPTCAGSGELDMRLVVCPWCGCTETEAEFVDVGFGGGPNHGVQVAPYVCHQCGACEVGPNDENVPEEAQKKGWWPGEGW